MYVFRQSVSRTILTARIHDHSRKVLRRATCLQEKIISDNWETLYFIVAAMNCNFCSYWLAGKSYWQLKFGAHLVPRVEHVLAKPNLPLFDCFLSRQVYYFTLIRTNCNPWFRTINPRELIKPDLLALMYIVQEISSNKVY